MVGVPHRDLAAFIKGMLDLIEEVLLHHVEVELLGAAKVEGEFPDVTAHLSILGSVPIILGTGRHEVLIVVFPF